MANQNTPDGPVKDLEEVAKELLSKLASETMDEMAEIVFVERYLKAAYKWGRERGQREEQNRNRLRGI